MLKLTSFIALLIASTSLWALAEVPANPTILHYQRCTPWGSLDNEYYYYLINGEQVKHGDYSNYYRDGKLHSSGTFRHGKLHGPVTTYYKRLSTKSYEANYVDGKRHGLERQWSPGGKLLFECEYKHGSPWTGRTSTSNSSGTGSIDSTETWKTVQYNKGKKIWLSKQTIKVQYRHQSPDQQPNMKAFYRWVWHPYPIQSEYPFIESLPPYDKIPFLIDWCAAKKDSAAVAHSQLVHLSKVDFGEMNAQEMSQRTSEHAAWIQWWELTGSTLPHYRKTQGKRCPEAWQLVARGRDLEMPASPIALPQEYELKLTFRSGDYGGITHESITLKRDSNIATLTRTFSLRTDGPKTTEQWLPFSLEEADRTTRAVAYLIDHPWLLNDEMAINQRFWAEQERTKGQSATHCPIYEQKLQGRESFGLYYADASFSLKDNKGNIWWNDDPWSWSGGNPERYNSTAQPLMSTIYPFIASMYPESTRHTQKSPQGWQTK